LFLSVLISVPLLLSFKQGLRVYNAWQDRIQPAAWAHGGRTVIRPLNYLVGCERGQARATASEAQLSQGRAVVEGALDWGNHRVSLSTPWSQHHATK
jgi:hypothetical protein